MKPKVFLKAASNISDYASLDCSGQESYICHALCEELGVRSTELPEEYNEIVKLFEPTLEEENLFQINVNYHLTYGYFGHPNPLHQAERILACLFMYQVARDNTK